MKKVVLKSIICLSFVAFGFSAGAQDLAMQTGAEQAPAGRTTLASPNPMAMARIAAMWDVLFNHTLVSGTGVSVGYAGMCFVGNEFWAAKWASDTVAIFDANGVFVRQLRIAGVTGIRSMTYDGSFIYAGTNTNTVRKINPISTGPTLAGSITMPALTGSISVPANTTTRWISYDPNANGGAGGFWIGNYDTDILQVSMTGTNLNNTILATTHGVGAMYGATFDNFTAGGPYLWVMDQFGLGGGDIIQINLSTGLQTGVVHDVGSDVGLSSTAPLGGGLFMHVPQPGTLTLMGCLQGDPNLLYGYDMNVFVGLNEVEKEGFLSVTPSLASTFIDVKLDKQNNNTASMRIFDSQGRLVFDKNTKGINNYIDVSSFSNGLYIVKVIYDNTSYTTKFVKN